MVKSGNRICFHYKFDYKETLSNGVSLKFQSSFISTAYGVNPNCAATSAGEESDEEEDEWNYIQGDKKQDQQPTEQSEPKLAPSVGEPVEVEAAADHHQEDPVPALGSKPAAEEETEVQQQPLDEPLEELADPSPSDTDAFAAVVGEPSETIIDDGESREVDAVVELQGEEEALTEPVPAVASPVIPLEEVTFW